MSAAIPDHLFVCIDHVGVAVPDLDEAIAFYADAFGMQVRHQETNEEQGVREAMVGGRRHRPVHPAARARSTRPRRSRSSSTAPARASSRSPTASPTSSRSRRCCASAACGCCTTSPARGTADSRINFVHPKDAGGVLVELVEPAGEPELGHSRVTAWLPIE